MSTYYHGNSDIQGSGGGGADGLQTLILMNPAYVGYSDNQHQQPPPSSNFVFLNSNSNSPTALPHAPPQQHFVCTPTSASTASTQDHHQHHDVSVLHGFLPRVPYNLYNLPTETGAARGVTRSQQGLSLSLSSQQPQTTLAGYASFRADREIPAQTVVTAVSSPPSPSSASGVSNGVNGVQSVLLSSKYVKAAQELLDEVVNVGKGAYKEASKSAKSTGDSVAAASGEQENGGDSSTKRGAELNTAERQEIQMKKAKLVNMLDEVEQRYRQYEQQMQIVMSWFEQAAGVGSAKSYTALALETISKQFRWLKDAILGQIRGASKSLGEEDNQMEGSRLKYVDNQIRQQRALQQLGMIHHNAWRPQRGLPERSVSLLRAWLFEHFLHPYPKDSDKIMLAKQTGLTRSQVSNWFINARVRLWKPMVEEMYTEEMKEHHSNNDGEDNPSKTNTPPTDNHNPTLSTPSPSPTAGAFNLIGSSEIDSIAQHTSPKKLRLADIASINVDSKPDDADNNNDTISIKFGGDDRQGRDNNFTLMGAPTNFIGGFGSYPIGDLGRFGPDQFQPAYSGNVNGVSLTLGLPHCENLSMSGAHHQNFMPNQSMQLGRVVEIGEANDFGGMNTTSSGNVYENINIQNRKRFAAQLLPDFVA